MKPDIKEIIVLFHAMIFPEVIIRNTDQTCGDTISLVNLMRKIRYHKRKTYSSPSTGEFNFYKIIMDSVLPYFIECKPHPFFIFSTLKSGCGLYARAVYLKVDLYFLDCVPQIT